jgi:hypothetical protein
MEDGTMSRSRFAVSALLGALALVAISVAKSLEAQSPGVRDFEIRPYVGAYIPTGDQRELFKDAILVGAQASYRIIPQVAITGTVGWSPTEDRLTAGSETVDLLQYDVGAELRAPAWLQGESWDFSPFFGLGVGGRTYDYRDLDVKAKTNVAGYGALGGEFGFGQFGLRIEGRDYVSRFEPLTGTGETKTRNDVAVAAGLTIRF